MQKVNRDKSLVDKQKGVNSMSIENQKGANAIDFVQH